MKDAERPVYRFAGFSLDLGAGRLTGKAGEVELRPKSFDLLAYLVRNAGRVVPKGELMDAVWRGRHRHRGFPDPGRPRRAARPC